MPENLTLMAIVLCGLLLLWVAATIARRVVSRRAASVRGAQKCAIIDGSNVMHWKDGTPQIATVRCVVSYLSEQGFTVGVVFDANAGYLLSGKYQHDDTLSRALKLPESHVMVVPKGTQADPAILNMARNMKARIVTNDRFRDWAGDFPEVRKPGHLIPGSFHAGQLHLRLSKSNKPRRKRVA